MRTADNGSSRQQMVDGPVISEDASRLGTGAGVVILGLAVGRGVRLLTRVLIGRLLGAASLGVFELAWTLIQILTFAARSGLHIAVVRFGAPLWSRGRRRGLRQLTRRGLLVPLLVGGAVAAIVAAVAPWLASDIFGKPELTAAIRILAALIPLGSGLAVLTGAIQATQRMRHTVVARDLVEPVLQFVLFVCLWGLGLGLAAALWGTLIGGVLAFAVALTLLLRMTAVGDAVPASDAEDVASLRALVLFSLSVAVTGLLGAYLMWIDRLLIGYFMTTADVGIYAAAAQFGMLFALLLHGFSTVFTPMFAEFMDRGETERMGELYRVSTKWGLYLLLPLMAVIVVVPEVLLGGLFGAAFVGGSQPLRILLIGQLANVCAGQAGMILILGSRQRTWMALNAAAVTLNLVLDVLWIPRLGLSGAAAASALTLTVLFSSAVWFVRAKMKLFPLDQRVWKVALPVLAALAVVGLLRWLGLPRTLVGLATAIAASYIVAIGVRLLLPADAEDGELLSIVTERLRRNRRDAGLPGDGN